MSFLESLYLVIFLHLNLQDHGKKTMAPHVIEALEKASQYLTVAHYSPHTMRAFMSSKESGLFVREGFVCLS
jgi:hypothetical protein